MSRTARVARSVIASVMMLALLDWAAVTTGAGLAVEGAAAPTTKIKAKITTSERTTTFGQPVTFTATVTADSPSTAPPSGSVVFENATTGEHLGIVALDRAGKASLVVSSLPAGTHIITAAFHASDDRPDSGDSVKQRVDPAPTTTTLTAPSAETQPGEPVTFVATVGAASAAVVPTGTVTFFVDGVAQATVPLDPTGQAAFSTESLPLGVHSIGVRFDGVPNFESSASARVAHVVRQDYVVLGADSGSSLVIVQDTRTRSEVTRFEAFPGFTGGVRVAAGDVDRDFFADIVVAAGPGGGTHVKVFSGSDGSLLTSFLAFPGFNGGVSVAAGDVTGDGLADIIVAAGVNGHVKVFRGTDGALVRSFLAFTGVTGEVAVAAGDVNGDGRADIIVGAGVNSHVKVFSGRDAGLLQSFLAYPGVSGGVYVAAGDIDGDGLDEIITGAGSAATHVKAFDGSTLSLKASFLAFPGLAAGVRVAAGDVNGAGRDDFLVVPAAGIPHVRVFDGGTSELLDSYVLDFAAGVGLFVGVSH